MKRSLKLISLLLIASMVLSVCACDNRRKGFEPELLDEYEKIEHSSETVPEPPETDSTTPAPDPTTPEPTAVPTTAPGTNYQPVEINNTIDLIKLGEGALGMNIEEATAYLVKSLKIDNFTPVDGPTDSNRIPVERTLRYLDKDIVVDGITYKCIGMYLRDGKVYQVTFSPRTEAIFLKDESFDSKGMNDTLSGILNTAFGKPISGYTEQWIDFAESGVTGWNHGEYIIALFWGKSCQNKKGNDQLVLEISYPGDISKKEPSGQTPSNTDPTTPGNQDKNLTCDYVYVMSLLALGQNIDGAKSMLESILFIQLGDPVKTDNGDGTTTYIFSCNMTIDGYKYDQIDVLVGSKGVVYCVEYETKHDSAETITEMFKHTEGRFKQLIDSSTDEVADPGKRYVTTFKVADNISLTVAAELSGNNSRGVFYLEDKTQK